MCVSVDLCLCAFLTVSATLAAQFVELAMCVAKFEAACKFHFAPCFGGQEVLASLIV